MWRLNGKMVVKCCLISCGSCDKLQIYLLKTTFIILHLSKSRSLKWIFWARSKFWQGTFLSGVPWEELISFLSLASRDHLLSLAHSLFFHLQSQRFKSFLNWHLSSSVFLFILFSTFKTPVSTLEPSG